MHPMPMQQLVLSFTGDFYFRATSISHFSVCNLPYNAWQKLLLHFQSTFLAFLMPPPPVTYKYNFSQILGHWGSLSHGFYILPFNIELVLLSQYCLLDFDSLLTFSTFSPFSCSTPHISTWRRQSYFISVFEWHLHESDSCIFMSKY